jgi:hypothetical protein
MIGDKEQNPGFTSDAYPSPEAHPSGLSFLSTLMLRSNIHFGFAKSKKNLRNY